MKRFLFLLLGLTALALVACGPLQFVTLDVDALLFIPEEERVGNMPIAGGFSQRYPEEGIDSSELGVPEDIYANLRQFDLSLSSSMTLNEASEPITVTAGIYLSDSQATLYDEAQIEQSVTLAPDETQVIDLDILINEVDNPDLYTLITGGSFFLGVELESDGSSSAVGTVDAELTTLDITISADVSDFLSF